MPLSPSPPRSAALAAVRFRLAAALARPRRYAALAVASALALAVASALGLAVALASVIAVPWFGAV
ncbi:hypothetical protein GCM10020218_074100 [Dactylosporangium vinaceum]